MIIDNNKYKAILFIFLFVAAPIFAQERKVVVITDDTEVPVPSPKTEAQIAKERQDSIDAIDKKWTEYFNETDVKLDNLYKKLSSIDSDTLSKVAKYRKELEHIQRKFNERDCRDRLIENNNIENQYDIYFGKVADIEIKIDELQKQPMGDDKNWLLIIGIAAGILVMAGLPLLMQISAKRSARKQQKEGEWQTMNAQCLQIPQELDAAYIPLIQNLIMQYENFTGKKPKKMHKDAAIEKIKELKVKQLKIGKKINIT